MDEDSLTCSFFAWTDAHEAEFNCELRFEAASQGKLRFYLDKAFVTLNFVGSVVTVSRGKQPHTDWQKWCQSLIISRSGDIQNGELSVDQFLTTIIQRYESIKSCRVGKIEASEQVYKKEISEDEAIDFRQEVLDSSIAAEVPCQSAESHFIFKHALEGQQLLAQVFRESPGMEYSMQISIRHKICLIELELDLNFLDISEDAMNMFGLTFEEPVTVDIIVNESIILHMTRWTPQLIGMLEIKCLQNMSMGSVGCKQYFQGRIRKFNELICAALAEKEELPTFLDIQIIPGAQCCSGAHAEQAKSSKNFFCNLLFYLRESLESCTDYCWNCYEKLPSGPRCLRVCSKDICEFWLEEVGGLSVYAELLSHLQRLELDVSLASCAVESDRALRIFEPFPSFLLKDRQIRGKSGYFSKDKVDYTSDMDYNKDLKRLKALIRLIPRLQWLRDASCDEASVVSNIVASVGEQGRDVYRLLKYITATNRLSLTKLEGEDRIEGLPGYVDQYIVGDHPPETLQYFDQEKQQHGSFFAFHGSATENWYSILRNGLRNLSGSHLMSYGAGRGPGVYAAADFQLSLFYSRNLLSSSVWQHNVLSNPPVLILAIIEVIQGKYDKGGGIYAIPNERHIVLRYLLKLSVDSPTTSVNANDLNLHQALANFQTKSARIASEVKNSRVLKAKRRKREEEAAEDLCEKGVAPSTAQNTVEVSSKLGSKLQRLESAFSGHGSVTANKRILSEYKYLSTSKECVGISVEFGESLYTWIASLDVERFEVQTELKQDFKEFSERTGKPRLLVVEVRFDDNFPFSPPFLRVVRPRFAFRTGHITVGGSICMQSITPSGWVPARTVESIFIELIFNMNEGGARLDLSQLNSDYSLEEAQDAFQRVVRQHHWI